MIDNTPITEHWCEFHWSPYRKVEANGVYAVVALVRTVISRPEFRAAVARRVKIGFRYTDAAELALAELLLREQKPLCCIVGDETMANILIDARQLPRMVMPEC